MKYRLYNNKNRPKGTLIVGPGQNYITLSFQRETVLNKKFRKVVNKFLEQNNLKPVDNNASFRKHYNYKKYFGNEYFTTYAKNINPRTQKIEIIKIPTRNSK